MSDVEIEVELQNNSSVEVADVMDGYDVDQARRYKELAESYADAAFNSKNMAEAWAEDDAAPAGENTRSAKRWADVARQWAESQTEPDGLESAKSSKTWAEHAMSAASDSTASAELSSASAKKATDAEAKAQASADAAALSSTKAKEYADQAKGIVTADYMTKTEFRTDTWVSEMSTAPSTSPDTDVIKDVIDVKGTDGSSYGRIRVKHNKDGTRALDITGFNNGNSPGKGLSIVQDSSGEDLCLKGVSPADSASGEELVTAAWLRAHAATAQDLTLALTRAPKDVSLSLSGSTQKNLKKLIGGKYFKTSSGIKAGTYTLGDILQQLTNLSHSHTEIDCNCNCDCSGSDG